jgi:hypothetical protein
MRAAPMLHGGAAGFGARRSGDACAGVKHAVQPEEALRAGETRI